MFFILNFYFDMKSEQKKQQFYGDIYDRKNCNHKKLCSQEHQSFIDVITSYFFVLFSFQHMKSSQWNFLICCSNIAILLLRLIDAFFVALFEDNVFTVIVGISLFYYVQYSVFIFHVWLFVSCQIKDK